MIFDFLLRIGPAVQVIFQLGYEPKEEIFFELTDEQYHQLEAEGKDISKKWYTIIPDNPKHDVPELLVVNEGEKEALLDAAKFIDDFYQKAHNSTPFATFSEKLQYAATKLPPVFDESSSYTAEEAITHDWKFIKGGAS